MTINAKRKLIWFSLVALIVVVLDQWSKYVIRTTPELHRTTLIEGWLQFNYTSNPGMAMGITWADTWVISLIAIAATIGIVAYTLYIMNRANLGFMICMGLIIGGAVGNIVDRFTMAIVEGYGGMLDGHVVDFIHFKLEIGSWAVFPYIFNVADMAISVAIVTLVILGKWLLPADAPKKGLEPDPESNFEPSEPQAASEAAAPKPEEKAEPSGLAALDNEDESGDPEKPAPKASDAGPVKGESPADNEKPAPKKSGE